MCFGEGGGGGGMFSPKKVVEIQDVVDRAEDQ